MLPLFALITPPQARGRGCGLPRSLAMGSRGDAVKTHPCHSAAEKGVVILSML